MCLTAKKKLIKQKPPSRAKKGGGRGRRGRGESCTNTELTLGRANAFG